MMIKCRKCDYEMGVAEFLTYAEAYLIKSVVVGVVVPLFIRWVRDCFVPPTRGFIDGSMAGLANIFLISCPNCKKLDEPWYPGSSKKPKKVTHKKTHKTLNK